MPPIFSSNRIVADRAVDAEVRADADLAEPPRALVGGRAPRCRYSSPALGARVDDLAVAELELDARDVDAGRRADGTVKRIAALALVLVRAGEDLARGHVALAVGVDPGAALRRCSVRSVPSASMRSSRAPREPLDQRVLEVAQLAPGGDGVGAVEEQRARDEARRTRSCAMPACCGARGRRPQRRAPALRSVASRIGAARAGGAREPRRVDAGERARRRRAPGCRATRRRFLASVERERGEARRGGTSRACA